MRGLSGTFFVDFSWTSQSGGWLLFVALPLCNLEMKLPPYVLLCCQIRLPLKVLSPNNGQEPIINHTRWWWMFSTTRKTYYHSQRLSSLITTVTKQRFSVPLFSILFWLGDVGYRNLLVALNATHDQSELHCVSLILQSRSCTFEGTILCNLGNPFRRNQKVSQKALSAFSSSNLSKRENILVSVLLRACFSINAINRDL